MCDLFEEHKVRLLEQNRKGVGAWWEISLRGSWVADNVGLRRVW